MEVCNRNILFIINPISGIGKQKMLEPLLEEAFIDSDVKYDIAYTERPGHATEIAKNAVGSYGVVVAVGGDGSVNEVSQSLINTNVALGIVPSGSGNGLARHLQIPLDISDAIACIKQGNERVIDTATINDRFFVGIAGIGFDAHIGYEFSKFGKRGFWSYVKVTSREFFHYKPKEYKITIDGDSFITEAFLITIANSSQYGNDAYIAPEALTDDGQLAICILQKMPLALVPGFTFKLFTKKVNTSRFLTTMQGKQIVIEQEADIAHIDGEPVTVGKHLDIKVLPSSLKVIC